MSLLGRMLFLLCLFLLATMSIVGGVAYFNYRENCRIGELGVERAVRGVAGYAHLFLHTAENSVKQLARAPEILHATGALPVGIESLAQHGKPLSAAAIALRTLLDVTLYGSPRIQQAGFLETDGGFMLSPYLPDMQHIPDPRTRPWYTRAMSAPAGTVVRTSYLSIPGNEPVCTFSQAIYRGEQAVGVVYMEVSLRILSQSLAVLHPGTSGAIYVLDDAGEVIVAPALHAASSPSAAVVPQELRDAGDGNHYAVVNGVPMFWAVHTDRLGFRYIVTLDAEELLHDSNMLLLRSCIGAGLVLLIILVAGYAIAGSAVLPLARLESAANAVADGQPDAAFPDAAEFSGEIRGLRNAIVRMLVALRASVAAAQRTAQRASANERYALAALRDAVQRQRDCRDRLDAVRLAAGELVAAVERLAAADGDEERAAARKEGRRAARVFRNLVGNGTQPQPQTPAKAEAADGGGASCGKTDAER